MNKYSVHEFTPNAAQIANGQGHSWVAQEEIDHVITNNELAEKVDKRCSLRKFEVKACLEAACEVILEELLESNAVRLSYDEGKTFITIRPECKGSISDKGILARTTAAHAEDASVEIRNKAEESDLRASDLEWRVAVTVGKKFSEKFRQDKAASKVPYRSGAATAEVVPANGGNGGGNNPDDGMLG